MTGTNFVNRSLRIFALLALITGAGLTVADNQARNTIMPTWLEVEISIIGAASDDILDSAMKQVKDQRLDGLLIKLDTPGGALESTRRMVKKMMGAEFPVVVWVGPSGSRAGSAGAFITIAAHVAAMAPGTNIGAAKPVQAGGQDIEKGDVSEKIEQDTIAFIQSIAESRGRNTEIAGSFVSDSISITAEEALDKNVIDILAAEVSELFLAMDGRTIELQSGDEVVLNTKAVNLISYQPTLRQEFLSIISNPNLFYLLFLAGIIGLGFELTNPGSIFPGVVGGVCMVLALIATSVLPVSFGAMLLILAGVAFMVAEAFLPSFGILGIGGFVAFIIGSVLLVDPKNEQGLQISWYTIAPSAIAVAGISLAVGYLILKAEHSRVQSGRSALIGATAKVLTDFENGSGRVFISGENWQAHLVTGCQQAVNRGETVIVTAVDGLNLTVQPERTAE